MTLFDFESEDAYYVSKLVPKGYPIAMIREVFDRYRWADKAEIVKKRLGQKAKVIGFNAQERRWKVVISGQPEPDGAPVVTRYNFKRINLKFLKEMDEWV